MQEKILELYRQISVITTYLQNTDYKAIKFAEGELSKEEYEPTKQQRITWRKQIGVLENEIEYLKIQMELGGK
jgi:hypothetical protein